ncbi:MAG: ThiF family adenylyltransferase [Paludibacteraceae bacterium]|nr:ThiF family adenylyltransferase [Paludibacteraceae bacterium]
MFTRTIQCLGPEAFMRLQQARVLLFGVGGVGGWCAEALVRTGVRHLTLVDFDTVALSNINRQVVATAANVGQPKAEQMRLRLLSLNPEADITARCERFDGTTAASYCFSDFDAVVDAIDSVPSKVLLAHLVTAAGVPLFASMGAARRLDPQQVRVASFSNVQGCALARAMRQQMKRVSLYPAHSFRCVFSAEQPALSASPVLGSLAPVVGTFGMTLASLVIRHLIGGSAEAGKA